MAPRLLDGSSERLLSIMGTIALLQALVPTELRRLMVKQLEAWWSWVCKRVFGRSRRTRVEVHQEMAGSFSDNPLYEDIAAYVGSLEHLASQADSLHVQRCDESSSCLTFTLSPGEGIEDTFMGARVQWMHHSETKQQPEPPRAYWDRSRPSSSECKSFVLELRTCDRGRVLPAYLAHIASTVREIRRQRTQRKLYTNDDDDDWEEVDFNHPSTFRTLALAPDLKDLITADLRAFADGKAFYHSVGRAWKRGYLLYGPPGTGKSSLIAAMANFLNYDVYDLELTGVSGNSQLKSLLMQTSRRSIIVIEDIDCSLDLSDRGARAEPDADHKGKGKLKSGVTLSGLLNFTDGLWSCCGEERIFVFTTNHTDRLDPALLRSGRMDLHILLSYCTFPAFKVLAANYLGLQGEHELYSEVERCMRDCRVTPAQVVELLISNKDCGPTQALGRVLTSLQRLSSAGSTPSSDKALAHQPWQVPAPIKKRSKVARRLLKRFRGGYV